MEHAFDIAELVGLLGVLLAVVWKRKGSATTKHAHGLELARIAIAHAQGDVAKACDAMRLFDLREDGKRDFTDAQIRVLVTAAKAEA